MSPLKLSDGICLDEAVVNEDGLPRYTSQTDSSIGGGIVVSSPKTDSAGRQKKKKYRKRSKQQQVESAATTTAVVQAEDGTSEGYDGMEADLAALDLECIGVDAVVSTNTNGKQRKKNKNRRRKSVETANKKEEQRPSSPNFRPDEFTRDQSAELPPTPPASPLQNSISGKRKKRKNRKNGKGHISETAANKNDNDELLSPPIVAVSTSDVGLNDHTPLSSAAATDDKKSGSGKKNKNKHRLIVASTPNSAPVTPDHGAVEKESQQKSSSRSKKGKSSSSQKKSGKMSHVTATPTPDELAVGCFGDVISPHFLQRSGGSVGNVGFSVGELPPEENFVHSRY